jgi:hypothetical protein
MKKTAIAIFSLLLLSCNSSVQKEKELLKKENDLLKRELEIQKRESQLTDNERVTSKGKKSKTQMETVEQSIFRLKTLLNVNGWEVVKINNKGDFSLDMGSASAGRVSGNLKDLSLKIEHKPKRPGCADICPPMEILYFNCVNTNKCLKDPALPKMGNYSQSSISFTNLEIGKATFKLLETIKNNL